nr:reverse transcriptase domain-containing protein [Tanacetum cinerariifolium]
MSQSNQQVNMVNPSCETCGSPHRYSECKAAGGFTQGDVYAATENYIIGANQMTKIEKAINERPHGALPINTIPNPREDIKVITTQSDITLVGPSVPPPNPPSSYKEVERDLQPTMDKDEPSEAKKPEIDPLIRELSDTFLMGDTKIKFKPLKDIDDPVLILRVFEKPLDSLDLIS